MANNFTPIGTELQVNFAAANQNLDQVDPDVAVLTDGRFFVAFEDVAPEANVIGQFVNADGTVSGNPIDVEIDLGPQSNPAVASRAGGDVVVVWEEESADFVIQYSIVSSLGVVGSDQTLFIGNRPDVATLADGSSLVVGQQFDSSSQNIVFRLIDPAGNLTGVEDFIDNDNGDQVDAAVASAGNKALVVYADNAGPSTDIHARFFNGTAFDAEVTIADATGILSGPDVAALADGRFVVVWDNESGDQIEGRLVNGAGVPLGATFLISDAGGDNESAQVAALPDGGFIVTWGSQGGVLAPEIDSGDFAVLARRFDASGAPAGDLLLVNTGDPETHQGFPAIAANIVTGQAFIAFEDEHVYSGAGGDADPIGIRGRAFIATTDAVTGTGGDDILVTYGLGETIASLEGDDVISALGGNDVVRGGAGFDRILGGLGNDQLFGEGGEDLLKGEDGDDLLVGGAGRDVQLGGSGQDTFDFNKVAESRFGANHDLIKGFKHSEHDRIDLRTIDADSTTAGNQAFDLIGAAAFSGAAGELRFAGGFLQGDTNGDGLADLEVKVTGLGAAVRADFVL